MQLTQAFTGTAVSSSSTEIRPMNLIRIGTLVDGPQAMSLIPQIFGHGFESFSLTFWQTTGGLDLEELGRRCRDWLLPKGAVISCLSIFGNPLLPDDTGAAAIQGWQRLIDAAACFGTDLVTGFTGRIPGEPLEASLPRFKSVFGELARRAKDQGLRLAFENCTMDGNWKSGDWNIAHQGRAWELMFHELPETHLGLQWEPCHQLVQLVDPIPQLRKWAPKIFHVHGKDATIAWDVIREHGIGGDRPFAWHRTPGFGDSSWTDIIGILMQHGYAGSIDIEGYHDPVFRDGLEMTGQVRALAHLRACRGGDLVPNPEP